MTRLVAMLMLAALAVRAEPAATNRLQWFQDARFGMFIHWGLYAVPAGEWDGNTNHGEWIMKTAKFTADDYDKFAGQFNPVKFDAKLWADTAACAGMKYLVITAKHHDGFPMFDSLATTNDIYSATPYAHDPMKDLAPAVRDLGLRFCFYYSIADWRHPDSPAQYSQGGYHGRPNPMATVRNYAEYMRYQVRELLAGYGPIGILWFDGGGAFRVTNRVELLEADAMAAMIHDLQPECLINDRLGVASDYGTPEQKIPAGKQARPFEVCMTLNKHWGWNKADHQWKQPKEVIQKLADIASKGGNFLLNVGPTAEGEFPAEAMRILREVGAWMAVNGESIYGTAADPAPAAPAWGRVTRKSGALYLHVFNWPADGVLKLETPRTVLAAQVLARPTDLLKWEQVGDAVTLRLPAQPPDALNSVIKLYVGADG